jgi:hypothetical protein
MFKNYSNFKFKHHSDEIYRRYQYSCISRKQNKECVYDCYIFPKRNKNDQRINELDEILYEIYSFQSSKKHFQKYVDYNIKLSQKNVKIEIIREINCKSLLHQSSFELAIFYWNLKEHIRDLLISISYLKLRYIIDFRWMILKNIGFNASKNHIELQNFLYIGNNYNYLKNPDLNCIPEKKLDSLKQKGKER